MIRTVSTQDIRKRLGELLDRVALRHDELIIERKGRPLAVLVPVEKHEQLREAAATRLLDLLERQRAAVSQEEADRLGDEAKHGSRVLESS